MPQAPQFCESVAVLTQSVPQAVCPEAQTFVGAPPVPPEPPELGGEQAPSVASIKSEPNPKPRGAVFIARNCWCGQRIAMQSDADALRPINRGRYGNQGNTNRAISVRVTLLARSVVILVLTPQ